MHNKIVNAFLIKNEIYEEEIRNRVNTKIMSIHDYNPIFGKFGMYNNFEIRNVSIGNIIGYNYEWRDTPNELFASLDSFFDEEGSTYQNRSISMLFKSVKDMLSCSSFINESIDLVNLGEKEDVLFVSNNGLHRFTVLKILYLKELVNNFSKEYELKAKYTIPARVDTIDMIKTYSNYIIYMVLGKNLKNEKIGYYKNTGRTVLEVDGKKNIFTNEDLLEFLEELVKNNFDYLSQFVTDQDVFNFISHYLSIELVNKENNTLRMKK